MPKKPLMEPRPPINHDRLVTQLTNAVSTHVVTGDPVQRVEISMDAGDVLGWLDRQSDAVRLYWSNRRGSFEMAGVGVAAEFASAVEYANTRDGVHDVPKLLEDCRAHLSGEHRHQRFYGGFSFDETCEAKWSTFGRYRFVLPSVELGRQGDDYYAACQWRTDAGVPTDLGALLKPKIENGNGRGPHAALRRVDRPEKYTWMAQIEQLLSLFEGGTVSKVVMARESEFQFDEAIDAMALLAELRANTANSYHYGFQFGDSAFIGASPERLFRRDGRVLQSEALAGTRPRGRTMEQDAAIGRALLGSEKDRREHGVVLERITALLGDFCESIEANPDPTLRKLRHCQHLLCDVEAILHREDCDAEVLQQLHPTPAVGGEPRDEALRWISNLESFDRGWYAGPVGWISHDSIEFAVAIRSALVHGTSVSAYTGAGIVSGSNPEEEWAEIENKITDFQDLFPLDD